ncbi:MAG TPA: hypothetical protein VEQ58_00435, partial [Polyangiaceae bacterium]|nr:hypothetical protein [Polyangiaceae bacterium]
LVLLLGFMWPARARAEPPDLVSLEWSAPPECPGLEAVQARIRKLAGSLRSATKPHANATITRSAEGGLHLRLVMRSENGVGERNIDGKSCNDLAGAAAVALVLLLQSGDAGESSDGGSDSTRGVDGQRPEGKSAAGAASSEQRSSEPPPAQAPSSAPTVPAHAASSSQRPRRFLLQLPAATLGIGPVPGLSFGVVAAAGVSFERWRFLAGGTLWLKRRASTSNGEQQYGADISHVTGQLLTCRTLGLSRFELGPCATVSVQHVSARGTGAHIAPRTAQATWLGLGVAAQARAHVSAWFSVLLGLGVELETAHPRLSLESVGDVQQLLPVAGTLTLGAEWYF